MFDILAYLYETYFRPGSCPSPRALARGLSAVGFDENEISETMDWLEVLTQTPLATQEQNESDGFRVYAIQEMTMLGTEATGFIYSLEEAQLINPKQRELIVERALSINDRPMPLNKLKIITLILLWTQGKEFDLMMMDELLLSDEIVTPHLLH